MRLWAGLGVCNSSWAGLAGLWGWTGGAKLGQAGWAGWAWAGLGWAGLAGRWLGLWGLRGLELVSSHTFKENSKLTKMQFEAKFTQLICILFLRV